MERFKTLFIDLAVKLKRGTRGKKLKGLLVGDLATSQSKTMKSKKF